MFSKDDLQITMDFIKANKVRLLGAKYVMLCPFHPQRVGSFVINVTRGNYECSKCKAKGKLTDLYELLDGKGDIAKAGNQDRINKLNAFGNKGKKTKKPEAAHMSSAEKVQHGQIGS